MPEQRCQIRKRPDQVKEVGGGAEHLAEEAIDAAAYGITDTIKGVRGVARWRLHALHSQLPLGSAADICSLCDTSWEGRAVRYMYK
jgi:hypothetical protein